MRGFDIFVRVANRIAKELTNVLFVVVGSDRVCYGNDSQHIQAESFREHVIKTEQPDLSRFRFLGAVPQLQLVDIFSISDPRSPDGALRAVMVAGERLGLRMRGVDMDALRSRSNRGGRTGLVGEFFDIDGLAEQAMNVLRRPARYRELGHAGRNLIEQEFSFERTVPEFLAMLNRVLGRELAFVP